MLCVGIQTFLFVNEPFNFYFCRYDTVPVVMGASRSDYEKIGPPHSFIHVRDYASPRQLAKYLMDVSSNKTKYLKFFDWKLQGSVTSSSLWCKLCTNLHAPRRTQWYENIAKWWTHDGICDQPDFSDFTLDVVFPNLLKKQNKQ